MDVLPPKGNKLSWKNKTLKELFAKNESEVRLNPKKNWIR